MKTSVNWLAVKDPGKFWRQHQKRKEGPQGISTSAWYQAFSSLLAPEAPSTAATASIMGVGAPVLSQGNPSDHLHDPISATEITQALKRTYTGTGHQEVMTSQPSMC